MTEQTYRVIADRDRGDDMDEPGLAQDGDVIVARVNSRTPSGMETLRIERLVPTTGTCPDPRCLLGADHSGMHEAWADPLPTEFDRFIACGGTTEQLEAISRVVATGRMWATDAEVLAPITTAIAGQEPAPQPPTREQIAEVLYENQFRDVYHVEWDRLVEDAHDFWLSQAYAVLDLLQKGGER